MFDLKYEPQLDDIKEANNERDDVIVREDNGNDKVAIDDETKHSIEKILNQMKRKVVENVHQATVGNETNPCVS